LVIFWKNVAVRKRMGLHVFVKNVANYHNECNEIQQDYAITPNRRGLF